MRAEPDELEGVDLLAANLGDVRDPYTGYAQARLEYPVAEVDHLGARATMVYGYAESEAVLRDGETFSARINGRWMRPLLGRTILEMDLQEHFTHRGLIGHAFRPRAVTAWRDSLILPTVHELMDRFAARGRAELVRELTWQLPVRVFAQILGVPSIEYGRWQRWAIALNGAALHYKRAIEASRQVREFFSPVIEARRREPTGDLISDLVTAEVEGRRLDDELIHGFLRLLIPAGAETTYRLLSNLLFALLAHPHQLDALRADRTLAAGAIEETLRWEAPVQFAARETTRDTTLAGVAIPAGTPVTIAIGSANRDETRWADPERFDMTREIQSHVAFGDGAHLCLGAHLARLEANVALDAILDRLSALRLDGDAYMTGFAFRSPSALPVAFAGA